MNCQSTSTTRISAFSPRYYLPYMTDTMHSIHWHWNAKKGDACAGLQEGVALQVQHLWWGRHYHCHYHLWMKCRFIIRTSSFVSPSSVWSLAQVPDEPVFDPLVHLALEKPAHVTLLPEYKWDFILPTQFWDTDTVFACWALFSFFGNSYIDEE